MPFPMLPGPPNAFFLAGIFCSWAFFVNHFMTPLHTHFGLNYFVAAKMSAILKDVTATAGGNLHVSIFACSHLLLVVMILDSVGLLKVMPFWFFMLEGIRNSLPKASLKLFSVIGMIPGLSGC